MQSFNIIIMSFTKLLSPEGSLLLGFKDHAHPPDVSSLRTPLPTYLCRRGRIFLLLSFLRACGGSELTAAILLGKVGG